MSNSSKTDVQLRNHLKSIGVYTDADVESQVSDALEKGLVSRAGVTENDALDAAGRAWDLVKGEKVNDAETDGDEEGEGEEGGEDEGDEPMASDEGAEMIAKALTKALGGPMRSIASELRKQKARTDRVEKMVESIGDLAKALKNEVVGQRLEKGGSSNNELVQRIDKLGADLMKAITGPRGDFRGVDATQFAAVQAPGDNNKPDDKNLEKAIVNRQAFLGWLGREQKAALQRGDQARASLLYKATMSIDATTTNDELAAHASSLGFSA